jgi:hypothetical protein
VRLNRESQDTRARARRSPRGGGPRDSSIDLSIAIAPPPRQTAGGHTALC